MERGNQRWESAYPIEYERRLRQAVTAGEQEVAERMLNELLGHVYMAGEFDLRRIRPRVMELLVVLSRAAMDAGADSGEVLAYNDRCLEAIVRMRGIEELSGWLTGALRAYTRHALDFGRTKHSEVVRRAMEYVRTNYDRKFSLEDVARHVYLSRTYLSALFRRETGQSLFAYVNQVRVEKSKLAMMDPSVRLADVAAQCGFEDQSYFVRVFRRVTGMSPKVYRDSHPGSTAEMIEIN